ncbi:hypothetical protein FRC12_024932 [Ceratobasidium sp. 428]|nr:hypothetical protein FRC12_024932 [Ceratobasidium sp. 428]
MVQFGVNPVMPPITCLGRFYEISVLTDNGAAMNHVDRLIEQIPVSSSDRPAWIQSQRKRLEGLAPYTHETEYKIMAEENNCLISGNTPYGQTYVLDFDNEVFTVHGTIHFSLHYLPLATWRQYITFTTPSPPYGLARDAMDSSAPLEYIGTVWRLPKVTLETRELDENYNSLHAVETKASDWGVPNWGDLSPSQALSIQLVQAILTDHADVFANPDVADQRGTHNLSCWQLVSAAAPSLLVCPPGLDESGYAESLPRSESEGYRFRWVEGRDRCLRGNIHPARGDVLEFRKIMREKKRDNWDYIRWTLRGCLIMFCPRLDTDELVKSEVVATVAALNGSPSGKSVGVVYSGKHVMAVAIDGGIVRHTPALLVHDLKLNIQDGALLLVHLLSSQLGNKTFRGLSQCRNTARSLSGGVFPAEILTEIIHYSDYEVYLQFFQVSHQTRSVCLSYPRVNESILLHAHAVNGGFMVRDRVSGCQYSAHMRRVDWNMPHPCLHSSFHLRQAGFGTADETGEEFVVPSPDQHLCRRFTESRRRPDAVGEVDMRMIVVWSEWKI